MSQITRCPACATSFRVVVDQLRIAQGWVRCGQCGEVFEAPLHLVHGNFVLLTAPVTAPDQVELTPDPTAAPAAPDVHQDADLELDLLASVHDAPCPPGLSQRQRWLSAKKFLSIRRP